MILIFKCQTINMPKIFIDIKYPFKHKIGEGEINGVKLNMYMNIGCCKCCLVNENLANEGEFIYDDWVWCYDCIHCYLTDTPCNH